MKGFNDSQDMTSSSESMTESQGSFDSVNKQAFNFANSAISHVNQWLDSVSSFGMESRMMQDAAKKMQSTTSRMVDGGNDPKNELPIGPGNSYMNHLFKFHNTATKTAETIKDELTKGTNIFTDASEALKLAIKVMGVMNEKNPGGLPIEINEAQKIWFGDKDVDDIQKTQWRTTIEMANPDYDPKKIRKFTNYDGSMTWEILNNDKTVMSRFTLGEHNGTKIFSQGGYKKFVALLDQLKSKLPDGASEGFEQMRRSM